MRLIDELRRQMAEITARRARVSGWRLDERALEQLRREAADDNFDIPNITTPPTFLGVPIEIVFFGPAQADFIPEHCKFAPCQRLDRDSARQWDIFDLDACAAQDVFYATKDDASRTAARLDIERGIHPIAHP
ncbi:hypothetical protein [Sphingobium sp.]|uniref:hypothetical protein n=1 Tax=Sphingobium sp. TaxID=1912891 RepID=UPI003BB79901